MEAIQTLLGPIGTLFHTVFYEPMYNLLIIIYLALHTFIPVGAFAVAIVVLTLLLRSALIPLTRKQLKSSRAMQELAPRLKELQARHRNDPQALMAAQQALYKEHGVSPVSGCLPLVVQMPFIYALYYAFFAVLQTKTVNGVPETAAAHLARINADIYPFIPHLTQMPDMHFFWTSLAVADPLHILPILAGIFTFLQMRMALPVRAKNAPRDTTSQATGMMQYFMPFFTIFIAWGFPSGLSLYWVTSTIFSGVQQYFISGWGSLFVGVPGMEHMVPEPKDITAPSGGRVVSSTAVPARGLTESPPQPAQPGGFRGMLRQMREQLAAATESAQAQREGAGKEESHPEETRAIAGPGETPTETPAQQRERRQRPPRTGPVLVKPSAPPPTEEQPAPAASETQPEAETHTNGNGAKPTGTAKPPATRQSGQGAATGTNGTGGTRPSGQRKGGSGHQKGSQSSRSRGGRPKGGR